MINKQLCVLCQDVPAFADGMSSEKSCRKDSSLSSESALAVDVDNQTDFHEAQMDSGESRLQKRSVPQHTLAKITLPSVSRLTSCGICVRFLLKRLVLLGKDLAGMWGKQCVCVSAGWPSCLTLESQSSLSNPYTPLRRRWALWDLQDPLLLSAAPSHVLWILPLTLAKLSSMDMFVSWLKCSHSSGRSFRALSEHPCGVGLDIDWIMDDDVKRKKIARLNVTPPTVDKKMIRLRLMLFCGVLDAPNKQIKKKKRWLSIGRSLLKLFRKESPASELCIDL